MRNIKIFIQIIIGIVIIAIILNKFNITEVISILKQTNPLYFVIACIFYFCMNAVLALRLDYLLTKIGYKVKLSRVFLSHMGGMIAGDITPGRSGYLLTSPLLKKNAGTSITDGMACIFAPQGIEFILKVGGAIAAIYYISTRSVINKNLVISVGIGAALLLILGILMLVISWHDESTTLKFIHKMPFLNKFAENLTFFKERSIQIKDSINAILILYIIGWGFAALHWFYLGKALGIELSYLAFFLLHPLLTILMFVPISLAGFGIMELGAIGVMSLLGILPATALAFSALVRVSILLIDLLGLKIVLSSVKKL